MKYVKIFIIIIKIKRLLTFDHNLSIIKENSQKSELPNSWDVPESLKYLNKDSFNHLTEDYEYYNNKEFNQKNYTQEQENELVSNGVFSKIEKKYSLNDNFQQLENIREDLINNWCFNIKYGSNKIFKETNQRILLHFLKKTNDTKQIKNWDEFILPSKSHQDCWKTYSKLITKYKYEFYDREMYVDTNNYSKMSNYTNTNVINKISHKFEYNKDMFESMGLKKIIKILDPINFDEKVDYKTDYKGVKIIEKDVNFLKNKYKEKQVFLLRYTCELYMNTIEKISEIIDKEFENYNFKELLIENHIYKTWKKLYLRSPSHSLWYIFKQLIPIRGDLTVFNLSNGDLPLLPRKKKLSIPEEPPDFFEFTTLPKSCSNNLVALSLNFGYRIQLGIPKTPKYVHFGKLYRYFESSLTVSYTSWNLCKRAIKLLTMFQAYYYKSIDEYKPDPSSYFYWQTPDWETLSAYKSYLPVNNEATYPTRNQFVWCLLWSSSEYTRTFSRFRINPIKFVVVDVSHIPMKMQNVGMKPNLESCFILIRYLWMAKLLRINKRSYRPLRKDSANDVLIDYSSIYYICVVILKCRATFHRAYLKNFYPDSIDSKIERKYDTQDPYSVYNNMNKRFLILNLPKLRSLKKVKSVLYGVVSTVLFGAITGILLLNLITSNNNAFKSNYNNPLMELNS